MPLDLDCTDPMYLLGRVVAVVEGLPAPGNFRTDAITPIGESLLDVLLVHPAKGLGLLAKRAGARWHEEQVASILAILPSTGLPKGPMKIERQGSYWIGYYHQRSEDARSRKIVRKFDPEVIRRVGEALFGPDHWQAEMTRALGLSDTSRIRAWISDNPDKRRRVPAGVCHDLMAMLRLKSAEATALADEIDGG